MEKVFDRIKLNGQYSYHENHFNCENQIVFILIFRQFITYSVVLFENLFEFPTRFSYVNQELADFSRQLINVLFSCSSHFLFFIQNVKLHFGYFWRSFLKANWIKTNFIKLYLHIMQIINIWASLIYNSGIFIINHHVYLVSMRIKMITEKNSILYLFDLKLNACWTVY